jgi:hypothetical protein
MVITFLYPRRSISGISNDPSIEVFAKVDPLVAAKIVPETTANRPSLPGIFPIQ